MALRHLAVAGGVAFLSAHLFRSMRSQQASAPNAPSFQTGDANARKTAAGDDRSTGASSDQGRSDDRSPDTSPNSASNASAPASSSGLAAPSQLGSLKEQERPEMGFPSDTANDADRARPGLGDFARGA